MPHTNAECITKVVSGQTISLRPGLFALDFVPKLWLIIVAIFLVLYFIISLQ